MGNIETYFKINNHTYWDIVRTECPRSSWDGFDFPDESRAPSANCSNLFIKRSGGRFSTRLDLRDLATGCYFTMNLYYSDGSLDIIRVSQQASRERSGKFELKQGLHVYKWKGDRTGPTLTIDIWNSNDQIKAHKCMELIAEAERELARDRLKEALQKLNEADEKAATYSQWRDIYNMSERVKLRARAKAEKLENEAWQIEQTLNKCEEALQKFNEAQDMLKQTSSKNVSLQLYRINKKLHGTKLFTEGNKLEEEAFKLFLADDISGALIKYEMANKKYDEAIKDFEAGARVDSRFDVSVKIARHLSEKAKVVQEKLEDFELATAFDNVIYDERKNENASLEEESGSQKEVLEQVWQVRTFSTPKPSPQIPNEEMK